MRIAHLSDPHLMRGTLAAQPAANLAEAFGRLLAIEPRPDCVVITGDLADTGHPEEHAPNTVGNFCFEVTLGYRRLERGQ